MIFGIWRPQRTHVYQDKGITMQALEGEDSEEEEKKMQWWYVDSITVPVVQSWKE